MALTAESALPLENETTDKKRKRMGFGQMFAGGGNEEDEKDKPSLAEKTAADWIKPGGGYDEYKKGDAEREKRLPIGGMEPMEGKTFTPRQPLKPMPDKLKKPAGKRKSIGQMISEG